MIEEKVKNLINNIIEENGYLLDEVLYVKEGSSYFLRVVIDKTSGYVNIEDCIKVNKLVEPVIDEANIIKDSYILDICSKEKGSM